MPRFSSSTSMSKLTSKRRTDKEDFNKLGFSSAGKLTKLSVATGIDIPLMESFPNPTREG